MNMKNIARNLVVAALFLVSTNTHARNWVGAKNQHANGNGNTALTNRANCAPATTFTNLEFNNVRAIIETGGIMWSNRANSFSGYEVPKGSGQTVIYAGALWMGGTDINNQLKIAAMKFGQNQDFWAGPLSTDNNAEITADACSEWDKFFLVNRKDIIEFAAWYDCGLDPTCNQAEDFPGYTIPEVITTWPAHGNTAAPDYHSYYLAPFYDRDNDGVYDYNAGDYPWYDLNKELTCGVDRTVTLFGDQSYWWVFNDKGNIHTETQGDPIGMEIHAQAFAFATNDEINDMTFYNYEMINRSTQTLTNTFFGQYVDADVGCASDDYVGCDVGRGLGFAYNGNAVDNGCNGTIPYGANPPAIGIDFFEGPYQDNDGIDNPGPSASNNFFVSYADAVAGNGIPYKGIGIGYGDSIPDNERFGMRRFNYYNNANDIAKGDPSTAPRYYNFLQGFWGDGSPYYYGGSGYQGEPNVDQSIPCLYLFPGESDPLGFGTGGQANLFDWSEVTNNNAADDRRFLQSAGPFTLEPGAVNNITVGVVYGRANSGGLLASVEEVKIADDKAQALFDNCFRILEGPDAPDVDVQELDQEAILYLSNAKSSNNFEENYFTVDPLIITPDSLVALGTVYDDTFRFEGYQIFQLKNEDITASDLHDIDKARLVAQCDIKNGVTQLINWEFNKEIGAPEPVEEVVGADEGISHSFKFTEDEFATGERTLINFKKYYYMAIAYGYNEFKKYEINASNPDGLYGQQKPYLASRKNGTGGEIQVITVIPHKPIAEANGTEINSVYGSGPEITRIEGEGNGGNSLDFTDATEATILANGYINHPTYKAGNGPIDVKVIDPLNVVSGEFELKMYLTETVAPELVPIWSYHNYSDSLENARWLLVRTDAASGELDTVWSQETVALYNEQLIPEWGISVSIHNDQGGVFNPSGVENTLFRDPISATVEFADSSKRWLTTWGDGEGCSSRNWIRSGSESAQSESVVPDPVDCNDIEYSGIGNYDSESLYEGLLGGGVAPYVLVGRQADGVNCMPSVSGFNPVTPGPGNFYNNVQLNDLESVDIVFTSDKSKWTRCAVIEMQDDNSLSVDGTNKQFIRPQPSVGKNGLPDNSGTTGMSWFPGYAISLETGERLNMAFSEDTYLGGENGNDMVWNPTSTFFTNLGEPRFGGKHYIYVFKATQKSYQSTSNKMPAYDQGQFIKDSYTNNTASNVWSSCMWVMAPLLEQGETLSSNDARIKLRVNRSYNIFPTVDGLSLADSLNSQCLNSWAPMYRFSTADLATTTNMEDSAFSALDLIRVVPNPYYAYSDYETNRLDNRVKLINLPEQATISIYTVSGVLVRTFTKDDPLTSLDWDLKNQKGIPIAGGSYIIHIKADNYGTSFGDASKRANERIVKFFCVMRPPDLENF